MASLSCPTRWLRQPPSSHWSADSSHSRQSPWLSPRKKPAGTCHTDTAWRNRSWGRPLWCREDGDCLEYYISKCQDGHLCTFIIFTVVVAAVAIGELQLDDGLLQARSDPADLSLDGETVVLQPGGGDEGAGGSHDTVTGPTALS